MVPPIPREVDRITAGVLRNVERVVKGNEANQTMIGKSKPSTTTLTPPDEERSSGLDPAGMGATIPSNRKSLQGNESQGDDASTKLRHPNCHLPQRDQVDRHSQSLPTVEGEDAVSNSTHSSISIENHSQRMKPAGSTDFTEPTGAGATSAGGTAAKTEHTTKRRASIRIDDDAVREFGQPSSRVKRVRIGNDSTLYFEKHQPPTGLDVTTAIKSGDQMIDPELPFEQHQPPLRLDGATTTRSDDDPIVDPEPPLEQHQPPLRLDVDTAIKLGDPTVDPEPPPKTTSDVASIGPSDPQAWLTTDMSVFFPSTIKPPRFDQSPRPLLCRLLKAIAKKVEQTPNKVPFRFERTPEAAAHNSEIIQRHGYSLANCFKTMPNSTVSPGSEFRKIVHLEALIGRHPYWPKIKKTMTEGASAPVKAVPLERARVQENIVQAERGNHKSAKDNKEVLHKQLDKDITKGFALPILLDTAHRIHGSRIIPMSIQDQFSIDEKGNRIKKQRLCQDQSFSNGFCPSTNDMVDEHQLTDLVYGKTLERIIHYIVALRTRHPTKAIFIGKYDIDAAYRRITSAPDTCAECIVVDEDGIAHIYLRLTFGGSPNPAIFCEVSEVATDLANEILLCPEWTPSIVSGPLQKYIGEPVRVPEDVPFGQAAPMAVDPDPQECGKVDVFVDDLISAFLDTAENIARVPAIIPLVLHLLGRPVADDEPIDRNEFLSITKLLAEGTPAEIQTVLGWLLDAHRLLVLLPKDKYDEWTRDIRKIIKHKGCQWKMFRTTKGRLNHCGMTIPHMRHFLNRMHQFEAQQGGDDRNDNSFVRIPSSIICDLELMLLFLKYAYEGVSMNLLTIRRPTHVYASDSCKERNKAGMGGYSVTSGRAWRFQFPRDIANDPLVTNNLLEYMATVVTIWIDEIYGHIPADSSILSTTDSSSAAGWLHKSSFRDSHPGHEKISRHLARLAIEGKWQINPQHIRGIYNFVSDLLSRELHMPNDVLLTLLRTKFHAQIPKTFQIFPLPPEVESWIYSTVQSTIESGTEKQSQPTRNLTGHGIVGWNTWRSSASLTTNSSTASNTSAPRQPWSNFSSYVYDGPSLVQVTRETFEATLSGKPLANWWRASGQTAEKAPATSRLAPTRSFAPNSTSS
jgi:hypothetical protein